ncbi:MAG TPA: FkbM family methyltransferase [Vicinamibacterales bacterium]|nr:FkbM family methyltransferase [Vicinamibacterales bacterium]
MPASDRRSPLRRALVACRTSLGAAIAEVIARAPALEAPFVRISRRAARRPGLVFGLCWAVNTRLNECLRARDTRFRQVTIGPHRVWLDVTDQSGFDAYFYGHLYEPILTATLLQHLHDGDVFVDIGANAGLFSMLAAKLVGPSGRVIAFEPHPGARAEMMRLLDRNAVADRVDVVSAALSDRDGHTASLHITSRSGLSTLDPSVAPGRFDSVYAETVTVAVTTLDAWMAPHPDLPSRIALIKIDVEGLEDRVVSGMLETLRRAPEVTIVCETSEDSAADRLLTGAGFDAATLEPPDGAYLGNRLYSRRRAR